MKRILTVLVVIILLGGGAYLFTYLAAKEKKAPVVYEIKQPIVTDIIKKNCCNRFHQAAQGSRDKAPGAGHYPGNICGIRRDGKKR